MFSAPKQHSLLSSRRPSASANGLLSGANSGSNTASAAGGAKVAKYANYTLDGSYTAAYHGAYRHSGWVKVSRLNKLLSEGDLVTIFSQFGEVVDVRLSVRTFDGHPLGFGYIEYLNAAAAAVACDCMNSCPVANIEAASQAASANEQTRKLLRQGETAASNVTSSSGRPSTVPPLLADSDAPQPFICKLLPTDVVGIEVDHCDVTEVPALLAGAVGYGHWFQRVFAPS